MALLLLIATCIIVKTAHGLPDNIQIGGLFQAMDDTTEVAFRMAAERVNANPYTLPGKTLSTLAAKVPQYDSFQVNRKVCELLNTGVAGVFGPQSVDTSDLVQSLCDTMEVPHIETRWDLRQRRGSCLVNLYPHPAALAKVYVDIVKSLEWKSFTIVYDDNDGLMRVSELLKMYGKRGYPVTVRQLSGSENYRPVLREIKKAGEQNIVLDCSLEKLFEVLKQAQQVGLMGEDMNYVITSLDMHTIDLEPFMHGGVNITGVRLIDPEDKDVRDAVKQLAHQELMEHQSISDITPETLRVETALIYDAVHLFAKALHHLELSQEIDIRPLSCENNSNWEHGYSIINYMKTSELKGLTGLIKYDHEGFRTNFKLDIVELTGEGLQQKGSWNSTEGLNLTAAGESGSGEDLKNMTFIVLTALTHPYGMLKEASQPLTGNDRYEGFGIDLIHELSLMVGFNYTIRIQADRSSGNPIEGTKPVKWTGMIGEVLDGRADLAIADITITGEREKDADFTLPFMNLGISILYRKPIKEAASLFSFLSPFSDEVWFYMIAAYIGVSMLLFFMGRISPYEWTNPYPCIEEPESLENQFSLNNAFWFTLGSIMQQGSEIAPIAVSTRMVASIWWFFTLIMVTSYTANLAAFLTVETTDSPFKDVKELSKQTEIKYGAKGGGSTANFFRDSTEDTYRRMWKFMEENPDVMTTSNEEGVKKVLASDKYAFLMESTSIEYEVERNCILSQIGGLLDNKGYGIAMRKNSSYRNKLSTSVVSLQETGKLTAMKNKWWKEKRGGGACQADAGSDKGVSRLTMENLGGVYVVLLAGVVIACLIAVSEVIWDIGTREDKGPLREELMEELKFIARCRGTTKPVRKRRADMEPTNGGEEEEHSAAFDNLAQYPAAYDVGFESVGIKRR